MDGVRIMMGVCIMYKMCILLASFFYGVQLPFDESLPAIVGWVGRQIYLLFFFHGFIALAARRSRVPVLSWQSQQKVSSTVVYTSASYA